MIKTNQLSVFSILLAIVIEVMSMGLFMPLLPDLFWSPSSPLLAPGVSDFWRQLDYGLAFAFWAIGIFFGAPFLGNVSDRIGRKKVLVLSLFFVTISYFFSFLSLVVGSNVLFMLSRVMSGFFASSFPIAQAIIVDTSPNDKRARNLGWISLAASIGVVFGPFLSGVSYHFGGAASGAKIAFLVAAGLTLGNTLSILFLLKETMVIRSNRPIHFLSVFNSCKFAFFDKRVQFLTLLFLLLSTLWAFYFQSISVVLVAEFAQGPVAVSWFYTFIGVGLFIMTLFIQPNLLKRFSLKGLGVSAMMGMGLFFGLGLVIEKLPILWGGGIFGAMLQALCYTVLMTLFSKSVGPDEQGRVMGGVGAVFGLTWGVISPLTGLFLGISPKLPIFLSVFFCVIGFFCMMRVRKNA